MYEFSLYFSSVTQYKRPTRRPALSIHMDPTLEKPSESECDLAPVEFHQFAVVAIKQACIVTHLYADAVDIEADTTTYENIDTLV